MATRRRRFDFGKSATSAALLVGEAKDLFVQLGVPLAQFREKPGGPIKTELLKAALEPLFQKVFAETQRSYRNLLSRSSPNHAKGPYSNFGPPGARVTDKLYNALVYNFRVDPVRFVGRIFEFDVGYNKKVEHFRALDTGIPPTNVRPKAILAWANQKFGWGLSVTKKGRFRADDYNGIAVSLPGGEGMSVSQAVWLLSKGVREHGLKALQLRENLTRFIQASMVRNKVQSEWLLLSTRPPK